MGDNTDRAKRLSDRWDMVAEASNRAYDLADRQDGTPVGRRATEISHALADRLDPISDELGTL